MNHIKEIVESYKKEFDFPLKAIAYIEYHKHMTFPYKKISKILKNIKNNDEIINKFYNSVFELKFKVFIDEPLKNLNDFRVKIRNLHWKKNTWKSFEEYVIEENISKYLDKNEKKNIRKKCDNIAEKYGFTNIIVDDWNNPMDFLNEFDKNLESFCDFLNIEPNSLGLNKIAVKYKSKGEYSYYSDSENLIVLSNIQSFAHEWIHFIDERLIHSEKDLFENYGNLIYKNKNLKFNNFLNLSDIIKNNLIKNFNDLYRDIEDFKNFSNIFINDNSKIGNDFSIKNFLESVFLMKFGEVEDKKKLEELNLLYKNVESYIKVNNILNNKELVIFYQKIKAIHLRYSDKMLTDNKYEKIKDIFIEVVHELSEEIKSNKEFTGTSLLRISQMGDKFCEQNYFQNHIEILARSFEFYMKNRMPQNKLSQLKMMNRDTFNCFYPNNEMKDKAIDFWDKLIPKLVDKYFVKKSIKNKMVM